MSNEIQILKEKLIHEIAEISEIKEYIRVKKKVETHAKINEYTDNIKDLQKQLVNAEKIGKHEQVKLLEKELEDVRAKLDDLPIYQQFTQASDDAQVVLSNVSEIINTYFLK